MQQRPWFPPGCWTHVQWCEGSGSHRPQGHTGVLKSPKRTIRGVQTSPNPLPQRGAPGAQSPTATSLPKVARCPQPKLAHKPPEDPLADSATNSANQNKWHRFPDRPLETTRAAASLLEQDRRKTAFANLQNQLS
ncbi:unnamed protein product [Rangifer tarandus platyrhynchus]